MGRAKNSRIRRSGNKRLRRALHAYCLFDTIIKAMVERSMPKPAPAQKEFACGGIIKKAGNGTGELVIPIVSAGLNYSSGI